MKQIRKRLTYANVMSSIAVFLVLGGATAFAASKITSKQLAANSVTTAKIKKSSVTTSKIKDNSITTTKVANGAITGAKLNLGSVGKVPSATTADTATTATTALNANTVGGQSATKIFKKLAPGAGTTSIATFGGFSLTASCPNGSPEVIIQLHSPPGIPSVLTSLNTGDNSGEVIQEYEAGVDETITLSNDSLGESTFSASTTGGTVVSGNLGFDYPNTFQGEAVCVIYGEAFSG